MAGAAAAVEGAGQAPVDTRPWWVVVGLLVAGSLLAFVAPALWLDWQPALAFTQPWRAFSAAWVHWSEQHLGANLLAAAVVAAYGHSAQVPRHQAWAWVAAWPLTHWGLLSKPELLHYGGLSGVLHAGVAIVCLHLLLTARGRRRWIGAGVALGLVVKLVSEKPWGPALQNSPEWDIAVAPVAHTTGALAGLLCGLLSVLLCSLVPRGFNKKAAAHTPPDPVGAPGSAAAPDGATSSHPQR
jgi:rhomboid family GlyGly-CTERM serine protease